MSIFENNNYEDADYQRYLDWKIEQEEQAEEMQEYLEWEEARQQAEDEAAARYLEDVERETTGERIVREAVNELSVIHETDEEEEYQQVAQITVDGVYRYEIMWRRLTEEVRVEIDKFRDGEPMYYWYTDAQPIIETLSSLLSLEKEKFEIEGLGIFGEGREGIETEALPYEVECFRNSTWHDYASDGFAVQFNINTHAEYEETTTIGTCGHAEDDSTCRAETCGRRMTKNAFIRRIDEIWRENHPTRHGLDGTQCDCEMCERANEMPADMKPYHESVDEDRLPTVYECLSLPKRITDALIRNWVASQPDEDKACAEASELSETVRKIAESM